MNLYEITEQMMALDAILAEKGGDISDPQEEAMITQWMQEYAWAEKDKVDGYGFMIANIEADIKALKEEAKRLSDRAKVFLNRIERMKMVAKNAMAMKGVRKLEGAKFTISIQNNGGVLPLEVLVPVDQIPPQFIKVERSADNDKIRRALEVKDEVAVKIAKFGEPSESVRIR